MHFHYPQITNIYHNLSHIFLLSLEIWVYPLPRPSRFLHSPTGRSSVAFSNQDTSHHLPPFLQSTQLFNLTTGHLHLPLSTSPVESTRILKFLSQPITPGQPPTHYDPITTITLSLPTPLGKETLFSGYSYRFDREFRDPISEALNRLTKRVLWNYFLPALRENLRNVTVFEMEVDWRGVDSGGGKYTDQFLSEVFAALGKEGNVVREVVIREKGRWDGGRPEEGNNIEPEKDRDHNDLWKLNLRKLEYDGSIDRPVVVRALSKTIGTSNTTLESLHLIHTSSSRRPSLATLFQHTPYLSEGSNNATTQLRSLKLSGLKISEQEIIQILLPRAHQRLETLALSQLLVYNPLDGTICEDEIAAWEAQNWSQIHFWELQYASDRGMREQAELEASRPKCTPESGETLILRHLTSSSIFVQSLSVTWATQTLIAYLSLYPPSSPKLSHLQISHADSPSEPTLPSQFWSSTCIGLHTSTLTTLHLGGQFQSEWCYCPRASPYLKSTPGLTTLTICPFWRNPEDAIAKGSWRKSYEHFLKQVLGIGTELDEVGISKDEYSWLRWGRGQLKTFVPDLLTDLLESCAGIEEVTILQVSYEEDRHAECGTGKLEMERYLRAKEKTEVEAFAKLESTRVMVKKNMEMGGPGEVRVKIGAYGPEEIVLRA